MIVKTTKEILVESFRELADKRNIDKITIREITDNCGMAPATFYRHFQNKYDLIVWDYAQRMGQIMEDAISSGMKWDDIQLQYVHFYEEHKALFLNILRHTSGYDSFNRNMMKISSDLIQDYLKKVKGISEPDEDLVLYINIYCSSATFLVCMWLFGEIEAKPEKISELLNNSFPAPVREIIINERI